MQTLSLNEYKILVAINEWRINNKTSPNIRELCKQLNYHSTSTVAKYINSLIKKNFLINRSLSNTIRDLIIPVNIFSKEIKYFPLVSIASIPLTNFNLKKVTMISLPSFILNKALVEQSNEDLFCLFVNQDISFTDIRLYKNSIYIWQMNTRSNFKNTDLILYKKNKVYDITFYNSLFKKYYTEGDIFAKCICQISAKNL